MSKLETKDILKILDKVRDIARHAGLLILDVYHSDDFGIEHKSDKSPLTKADKLANDYIVAQLSTLTPDIPIISEESANVAYEQRKNYSYYWLVDPLDGTKEFIKRNGEFTVNIALVLETESIAGVIYVPVIDTMYWAARDAGAYRNDRNKIIELKAKKCNITDENLNVVCSRSHLNPETKALIDQLKEPQLVSKGSSLKFMIIAEGNAAYYPRMAPTMEWDTAAAQIILEEAGGSIVDHNTNLPMRYNKENLLNAHFIAYANIQAL